MRENDFWASTLRSIVNRIDGYYKHYELQNHESWERARMIAFFAVTPHTKKGKIKSPSDLIKFPWENKPKAHFDFEATKARALALFEQDRIRAEQKANGEIS